MKNFFDLSIFLFKILALTLSVVLIFQTPAMAFKPDIHAQITVEVLNATQPIVNGQRLQFSQEAIDQIVTANKQTDDPAFQTQTDLHFDNEDFQGGSKRLIRLRERVIKKVKTTQLGASARGDLGGALHSLQDFYAHSNWVELGNSTIDNDLGRRTFSGAGHDVSTCPNDPGSLGGEGFSQLTSGYFKLSQLLCGVPAGKCRHGVEVLCPSGINKDDPGRAGFTEARALATLATQDFLNQILEDQDVINDNEAVKLILGVR